MSGNVLGRRYAGALLDIAVKDAKAEPYGTQLAQAAVVLGEDAVRKVLTSPLYETAFKKRLVDTAANELQLAVSVANLLRLLLDRSRIGILSDIAESYRNLLDDHLGVARATVYSAVDLDGAAVARLRVLLQRKVGRKIELTAKTEPKVIGGMRIHVGSKVYDATIANHLKRLREDLKHQV